jgi:hypothetical protein
MQRGTIVLAALFLLSACGKPSTPDEFRSDQGYVILYAESYYVDVEVPFQNAWSAVRAALNDYGWEIDTEAETSGAMTTKEQTIGTNRDRYACRQWPGSTTRVDEMNAKLSIHVGSGDGRVTRIRALADINGRYIYLTSWGEEKVGGWWPCTSTGELESELFDATLTRLEPLRYVPPVYRKQKPR